MDNKSLVSIIVGSDSDLSCMQYASKKLLEFGIKHDINISSAHRNLETTISLIKEKEKNGILVFIIGAGMAAHLAGVVAGITALPVIAVPMTGGEIKGMGAMLSTINMPGGVPVATMSMGKSGAINSAIFAVKILSIKFPEIKTKILDFKKDLENSVLEKDENLNNIGLDEYIRMTK